MASPRESVPKMSLGLSSEFSPTALFPATTFSLLCFLLCSLSCSPSLFSHHVLYFLTMFSSCFSALALWEEFRGFFRVGLSFRTGRVGWQKDIQIGCIPPRKDYFLRSREPAPQLCTRGREGQQIRSIYPRRLSLM